MSAGRSTYGYASPVINSPRVPAVPSTGALRAQKQNNDLAGLINQQPLPVDLSKQYGQLQDAYAQQTALLGTYGSQIGGLQSQINQMYAADPTRMYMNQLKQLYSGDPLAAYRNKIMQQYALTQPLNQMVYGYGYNDSGQGF